jgi:hypothetical protein
MASAPRDPGKTARDHAEFKRFHLTELAGEADGWRAGCRSAPSRSGSPAAPAVAQPIPTDIATGTSTCAIPHSPPAAGGAGDASLQCVSTSARDEP